MAALLYPVFLRRWRRSLSRPSAGLHTRLTVSLVVSLVATFPVSADSALPLLGNFDAQRISSAYPATDARTAGELAKLIYRLRGLPAESWRQRVGDFERSGVGDVVEVTGNVQQIRVLPVADELAPYVDATALLEILIERASDGRSVHIIAADGGGGQRDVAGPGGESLGEAIRPGDRVAAIGVLIASGAVAEQPMPVAAAVAAADLDWFPAQVPHVGWGMLRDQGVDVAEILGLANRNRRSLQPADSTPFYTMLAAASAIGRQPPVPPAADADPVALLRDSDAWIGRWLRIELETVQLTQVFVTEPYRRQQLGRDSYFQIDAVADLGNVVIKLDSDPTGGDPVWFENRFPVSVVVAELPEFIRRRIDPVPGTAVVSCPLRGKILVEGFLFRLWSYSSQFMDLQGGGSQLGPLLIAADIRDREPPRQPLPGLAWISTLAAIAVIAAVLAIAAWHHRNRGADRRARRRRQQGPGRT